MTLPEKSVRLFTVRLQNFLEGTMAISDATVENSTITLAFITNEYDEHVSTETRIDNREERVSL